MSSKSLSYEDVSLTHKIINVSVDYTHMSEFKP